MTDRREPSPDLLDEVRAVVGGEHCLVDPQLKAGYERDWTGRFEGPALMVVRPGDTSEVVAVVRACARHGAAIVPQGGNTGLVGGSVPRGGEVVLSLRRLDRLLRCDPDEALLEAEAGVTLARAQASAATCGMDIGIDLAARDSATLGGMTATNAGGVHVVRHGSMRQRLAGIEVVLADGTVASRRSGLVKDNVGLDLPSLFAGSEGTLGIVTKVLLRLVARPTHRVVALVALAGETEQEGAAAATLVARRLRDTLNGLEAVELMFANGMELVARHAGLPEAPGTGSGPGPGPAAWLLVEVSGASDPTADLAAEMGATGMVRASAVSGDGPGRARLWAYRDRHTEAIATLGIPHKLDVALPQSALSGFVAAVRDKVAQIAPDASVVMFGHAGDGNLHVNVVGPPPDDPRVDEAVLRLVLARGGSISAEHGIGTAKRRFVALTRSAADIETMRTIKTALDPGNVLNPGVLLP